MGGHPVHFYKRAQLAAKMIHEVLIGTGQAGFKDLGKLTAFADYRLPQLLRDAPRPEKGVLGYTSQLAYWVDNKIRIPSQVPAEITLRACTIWAVEYIAQKLGATAAQVESFIWTETQKRKSSLRPHHLTRTTNY